MEKEKQDRIDEIMRMTENLTADDLMARSSRLVVLTLELPEACWLGLELAELTTGVSQNKFMAEIISIQVEHINRLAILETVKSKLK